MFSYDHTIEAPAKRGNSIKFFKTGLGFGENLEPLGEILNKNRHQKTIIDYLKVGDATMKIQRNVLLLIVRLI